MDLLERVLERQGVDERGQHAHVVGDDAVQLQALVAPAPPDIAAAHHDADLDVALMGVADLAGDLKK